MNTTNEITDGYVGELGKTWTTATIGELAAAIEKAADFNEVSVEAVREMLGRGETVEFAESPNFYHDHSYAAIRPAPRVRAVATVMCDCGHNVPVSQMMNASTGTSCPDCYDRMSE